MTRILIVEDNELNRDMLGRRLQRRGFDIIFAADVTTAVTMARMEEPSLILMDIGLGGGIGPGRDAPDPWLRNRSPCSDHRADGSRHDVGP